MRFCPFCSSENLDEVSECVSCARRLPPLPPRRRKNGLARTATVPTAVDPDQLAGLPPKKKGLADLAPSPAAGRREESVADEPPPKGV